VSAKEGLAKACCTNLKTFTYGTQTLEKLWKTKWAKLQTKLVVVAVVVVVVVVIVVALAVVVL